MIGRNFHPFISQRLAAEIVPESDHQSFEDPSIYGVSYSFINFIFTISMGFFIITAIGSFLQNLQFFFNFNYFSVYGFLSLLKYCTSGQWNEPVTSRRASPTSFNSSYTKQLDSSYHSIRNPFENDIGECSKPHISSFSLDSGSLNQQNIEELSLHELNDVTSPKKSPTKTSVSSRRSRRIWSRYYEPNPE